MSDTLKMYWQCCGLPEDKEVIAIDAIGNSLEPLDEYTLVISNLNTAFSYCNHEADKE